jgi:glycosyltransferase involved in cell wall biosynthesis
MSGVTRVAFELARRQAERGHEAHVCSLAAHEWRSEWRGIRLAGLRQAEWARTAIGGRCLDFRGHVPLVRYARRTRFDVVHTHLYSYTRFLAARARIAHFHSDPFFAGAPGESLDLKPSDFRSLRRHSHLQLGVSRFVAGEVSRGLGSDDSVRVVYNGVDHALYDSRRWVVAARELRAAWGIGEDDIVFLFAGALTAVKGVIPLAQAFAAARLPRAHLIIAGAGSLWGEDAPRVEDDIEGKMRSVLAGAGCGRRVHFLGNVPAANMAAVYAAADVAVIPSLWREAFPLTALEAMAAGRPVIASNTGGLPEMVTPRTGLLTPPGDVPALAAAMRSLASDDSRRAALGQEARRESLRFSWEEAVTQLDGVYAAALDRCATRKPRWKASAGREDAA